MDVATEAQLDPSKELPERVSTAPVKIIVLHACGHWRKVGCKTEATAQTKKAGALRMLCNACVDKVRIEREERFDEKVRFLREEEREGVDAFQVRGCPGLDRREAEVARSCGHTELWWVGRHWNQWIENLWGERCARCETDAVHNDGDPLPELTGTPAQVSWATTIRLKKLSALTNIEEQVKGDYSPLMQAVLDTVAHIRKIRKSEFWLKFKDAPAHRIVYTVIGREIEAMFGLRPLDARDANTNEILAYRDQVIS